MKCPKCNIFLVLSHRRGIEIDYCPDCRGVWLDRGELEKIIEQDDQFLRAQKKIHHEDDDVFDSRSSQSPQVFGQNEEYNHRQKKKKSLLDTLFDF